MGRGAVVLLSLVLFLLAEPTFSHTLQSRLVSSTREVWEETPPSGGYDFTPVTHESAFYVFGWGMFAFIFILAVSIQRFDFLDTLQIHTQLETSCENDRLQVDNFQINEFVVENMDKTIEVDSKFQFDLVVLDTVHRPLQRSPSLLGSLVYTAAKRATRYRLVPTQLNRLHDDTEFTHMTGHVISAIEDESGEGRFEVGDIVVRVNCHPLGADTSLTDEFDKARNRINYVSGAYAVTALRPSDEQDTAFCGMSTYLTLDSLCCDAALESRDLSSAACKGQLYPPIHRRAFIEQAPSQLVARLFHEYRSSRYRNRQHLVTGRHTQFDQGRNEEGEGEEERVAGNQRASDAEARVDSGDYAESPTKPNAKRSKRLDLEDPVGQRGWTFQLFRHSKSTGVLVFVYAVQFLVSIAVLYIALQKENVFKNINNPFLLALIMGGMSFVAAVLFLIAFAHNRWSGDTHHFSHLEQNYHLFTTVFHATLFIGPALMFAVGRHLTSNATHGTLAQYSYLMSWMEVILTSLFTWDAFFDFLRNRFKIPMPHLVPSDLESLMLGMASILGIVPTFLSESRANFANGGACTFGRLRAIAEEITRNGVGVGVSCESIDETKGDIDAQTVADGTACSLQCSPTLSKPVTCYDYGLIGADWTIIQEERVDTFCCSKHDCKIRPDTRFCPSKCSRSHDGCIPKDADCPDT